MRYIKPFGDYQQIINELLVHKSSDEGINFIMYKKDLWIFSDDEWVENEIWKDINEKLGEDLLEEDVWNSLDTIREEHPYILYGKIEDGYIVLDGTHNFRHSKSSIDLKKLKDEINLPIKVNYMKGVYLEDDAEYKLYDLENYKDGYYYHGTSIKYLERISKTGIRPMSRNSNYDRINHIDKIFFTSNIEKAVFHANTASMKTESFPIILKFKIPDVSKIVIDYDLAIDLYGEDNQTARELGYSNIKKGFGGYHQDKTIIEDSDKINIMTKLGIFGYTGRISPSFIESVLIDTYVLQDHLYLVDEDTKYMLGMELDAESEIWNEFSNVGDWGEMSMDALVRYVNELVEDYLSSFEEDEDE
jgi:hypothetical protein